MATKKPVRVLYMEDDLGLSRLLEINLKRHGYEIETAHDGMQGLAMLRRRDYDIVLVDYHMPGMNGAEVIREALRESPTLPAVLITGGDSEQIVADALKAGAVDCIVKDSDASYLDALPNIITNILQHREQLAVAQTSDPTIPDERYALALQGAREGIWDWDLESDTVFYTPQWKSLVGYGEHELTASPEEWFARVHPDDLASLREALRAHLECADTDFAHEHRIRHLDGSYRWVYARGTAARDDAGHPYRIAGTLTDVTVRKNMEEKLRRAATHDTLTQLPNRSVFLEHITRVIQRAHERREYGYALLFLDLDRFKVINDGLGHLIGDQLLVAVSERIQTCLRPRDTLARLREESIARLGGDEFALLLDDLRDTSTAIRIAERIRSELETPFYVGNHEIFTSTSIGIVHGASTYATPEELLRDADTALNRAKNLGRNRCAVFDNRLHEEAVQRIETENYLRHAVQRHELSNLYQPIVDITHGGDVLLRHIRSFEALLRWRHPRRGLLGPVDFLTVAQETGLMIDLELHAMDMALRQLCGWHKKFPLTAGAITMNINISRQLFEDDAMSARLEELLMRHSLTPEHTGLEIAEGVIMADVDRSIGLLTELKAKGFTLYLDDFGTGYSCLRYFHQLPVDGLKIDHSFVSNMLRHATPRRQGNNTHTPTRDENLEVIRTLVTLGHSLGKTVVAEGVETREQYEALNALSCEAAQGFLFSTPLTPEAADQYLETLEEQNQS